MKEQRTNSLMSWVFFIVAVNTAVTGTENGA